MSEQTAATEKMIMPKHGEFCWNELATNNLETCKQFYGELFGWQFKDNHIAGSDCEADGMIYNEISIDGKKQFGGMYQMGKEYGDMPPHWLSYIAVDDVDASALKVTELGGSICVPPMDIPNTGRFCIVSDPSGAKVSLITLRG